MTSVHPPPVYFAGVRKPYPMMEGTYTCFQAGASMPNLDAIMDHRIGSNASLEHLLVRRQQARKILKSVSSECGRANRHTLTA